MEAACRLPLMLTRNCPIQAQVGCSRCRHHLRDRQKASVYVDCTRYTDSPDYAELFNSAPVWLFDRRPPARCAYTLTALTDESPEVAAAVLESCFAKSAPPAGCTRGLKIHNKGA